MDVVNAFQVDDEGGYRKRIDGRGEVGKMTTESSPVVTESESGNLNGTCT